MGPYPIEGSETQEFEVALPSGFPGARIRGCLDKRKTGQGKAGCPGVPPLFTAWALESPPGIQDSWTSPPTHRTLGPAILEPPQGRFPRKLWWGFCFPAAPNKNSQEKAIHLHRPDLGRSHIQKEGQKEEQQQEHELNHLCRLQRHQNRMPQRRSPTVVSLSRHAPIQIATARGADLLGNVVQSLAASGGLRESAAADAGRN